MQISLSPPRIKTEPKFEPLDEDLDVGADAFPEHRPKSPAAAAVRTELGDEMENELPAPEKPKQKRLAETKPRKPRRSLASYKRVQSGENGKAQIRSVAAVRRAALRLLFKMCILLLRKKVSCNKIYESQV